MTWNILPEFSSKKPSILSASPTNKILGFHTVLLTAYGYPRGIGKLHEAEGDLIQKNGSYHPKYNLLSIAYALDPYHDVVSTY